MKDKWFVRRLYDQTLDVYIDDGDVKVVDYMNCRYIKESQHKKEMREAIEEGVEMGSEGDGYSSDHSADVVFLFKKCHCELISEGKKK
jgi:hypothetical protein